VLLNAGGPIGMFLKKIWNDSVWSKVIAGLILAFLMAVVSISSYIVLGLAVGGVILALMLILRDIKQPIVWNYGESFLGWVGGGGDLRFVGFQANGRNCTGKGITKISGYLTSDMDNSKSKPLHFVINGLIVLPSETNGIPQKADFLISIPFYEQNKYEEYLTEDQLLRQWGEFRFVVDYDDVHYERKFTSREVLKLLERARKAIRVEIKPEVRKKF
jgi:hypothetical protein